MYNFNALLSRTKYIPRWSLMRQNAQEDVAQHTAQVMFIAHTLCALANENFGRNVNSEKVVLCCLYHDVSEILTGDMPTPVKYKDETLKTAYKALEAQASQKLLATAHPKVQKQIKPYMTTDILTAYEKQLLKGADRLAALVKCIEELRGGNTEFKSAYEAVFASIKDMNLDETNFFIENMLESYQLCLDELAKI